MLNGFLRQVVVSRRDDGIRKWTRWLREDLSSRPYVWLRPDFLPPPFLVVKDPQTQSSHILVEPHLIDAEFRKAWMPFFCWSGHPVVSPDQFLDFVGHLLPQEPYLPRITGRDLQEVARAKSTAGGLDGWAWNEIKALPLPWFSGLAIFLELVETSGVWPQGLLDAYLAMIPKVDGDSTPLSQRPLSVLPVVYRLWASLRLGHLREWVEGWLLQAVKSLCNGLSSVEAWFSTALDIEEVLSGSGGDQLHVMVADVIKSFDTGDRSILDCALGRLGLLDWFRRVYFSFRRQVRLRFKLATAGLGELWCRDGGIPQGCPLSWFSLLLFMSPGVVILILCLMLRLNSLLITLSVVLNALVPCLSLLGSLLSMSVLLARMCPLVSVFFSALLSLFGRLWSCGVFLGVVALGRCSWMFGILVVIFISL